MPGSESKYQKTEDESVKKFREYLKIKTVHPNPDYDGALLFLKTYADEIGLPYNCTEVHPGRVILTMTWQGTDPSLSSIVLNSHTDVVPVYPEHWKCDAFEAIKMENGDIYARGTQDMKSVGIQYLEAVKRLKQEGHRFKRTIHLTFMPDEEIGGLLGMSLFVDHEDFKKLDAGFILDEGLANPGEAFTVFYGERTTWWLRVKCTGNPGHGSRFIENTAAEKLQKVINTFLEFRQLEKKRLENSTCMRLGDVTTVNLTMLEGGVQHNVVPNELFAGFDIRIAPSVNLTEFEDKVKTWLNQAGEGVTYEFIQKSMDQTLTSIKADNPYWAAFSKGCQKMGMKIETEVFPAGTDSRYLRAAGYPAIGFSPMNNTPILLHDHNEFLNENIFMKGIDIYCSIISELANVNNE